MARNMTVSRRFPSCMIVLSKPAQSRTYATCNFKKAITYPASVEIRMFSGAPGGSSLPTFYEMRVKDVLCADGTATVVFIDMQHKKPVRIPENLRAKFE